MGNSTAHLQRAKEAKDDEFYTKYEDIEKELKNYDKGFFEGKALLLNCDDVRFSQFYQYFKDNIKDYKLKSVDALHLKGQDGKVNHARLTITEDGSLLEIITEVSKVTDGDFRGYYSQELLKQADIVITNPPFSLVREYITKMEEESKQYLFIASQNATTYKEVYPLVTSGDVWLGVNSGTMEFLLPESSGIRKNTFTKDGKVYQRLGNVVWLTNIKAKGISKQLKLSKTYKEDPSKYPKYYNLDAIEVGKVADIPKDYKGLMGVPITYLNKHDPTQFEIVGHAREDKFNLESIPLYECRENKLTGKRVGTKGDLYRPIYKGEKQPKVTYRDGSGNDYRRVYSRYIIKRID